VPLNIPNTVLVLNDNPNLSGGKDEDRHNMQKTNGSINILGYK